MNKDVLTVLQEDFNVCKNFIHKVAKTLLNEEVSKYPIFVAVFEDQDIDLGIPILRREEIGSAFTFNASHLEEFANKGLVLEDKQAAFRKNFKDPFEQCCIFITTAEESSFVFLPYETEMVWEPANREQLN
jgi:hypothetical protein